MLRLHVVPAHGEPFDYLVESEAVVIGRAHEPELLHQTACDSASLTPQHGPGRSAPGNAPRLPLSLDYSSDSVASGQSVRQIGPPAVRSEGGVLAVRLVSEERGRPEMACNLAAQ